MYNEIKQGIFVKIKNNILVSFIVFINHSDKNIYEMDVNMENYFKNAKQDSNRIKWIVDCHMVTEQSMEKYIMTANYFIIRTLLLELLETDKVNDCEFFINPTSCPVLKHIDSKSMIYVNMNIVLIKGQEVEYDDKSAKVDNITKIDNNIVYDLRTKSGILKNIPREDIKLTKKHLFEDQYVIYNTPDGESLFCIIETLDRNEATVKYLKNGKFAREQVYIENIEIYDEFKFMPIVSFNMDIGNFYYRDICLPSIEDWRVANLRENTGVYPFDCQYYDVNNNKPWNSRAEIFMFRDYPYGNSVDGNNNLKINLAIQSLKYNNILDAKLVPTPDRLVIKDSDGRLYTLPNKITYMDDIKEIKVDTSQLFSERNEVINYGDYKYNIYIEGQHSMNSLVKLMSSGSLIIKIKGEFKSWTSICCNHDDSVYLYEERGDDDDTHIGEEFDHLEIELGELESVMNWCKTHDNICRQLAENSRVKFEKLITKNNLLDYWKTALNLISEKTTINSMVVKDYRESIVNISNNVYVIDNMIGYVKGKKNKNLTSIEKRNSVKVEQKQSKDGYTRFEVTGNFSNDVDRAVYEISQFNNVITEKILLPVYVGRLKGGYSTHTINVIPKFKAERYNIIKYFGLISININETNEPSYNWYSTGNKFISKVIDTVPEKISTEYSGNTGRLITIVGIRENVEKCITFIKNRLHNEPITFALPIKKLLDDYPVLEEYIDDDAKLLLNFDVDKKNIAVVVAVDNEISDFQNKRNIFINRLKLLAQNLKNGINRFDIFWVEHNKNIDMIGSDEKNKFVNEVFVDSSRTQFRFNKGGCFNVGLLELNHKEYSYDTIIFNDFDTMFSEDYITNRTVYNAIISNNDIVHVTHNDSELEENLEGIVVFKNEVISSTNGYPNYYWDLLDSSSELYRNCTKGLNWASGDFLFVVKRPANIGSRFFDRETKEETISKEQHWYNENIYSYRNMLNGIDNINRSYYNIYNSNSTNEFLDEDLNMNIFMYEVGFTHLCNPYYYNLDTKVKFVEGESLTTYVETLFSIMLPDYNIIFEKDVDKYNVKDSKFSIVVNFDEPVIKNGFFNSMYKRLYVYSYLVGKQLHKYSGEYYGNVHHIHENQIINIFYTAEVEQEFIKSDFYGPLEDASEQEAHISQDRPLSPINIFPDEAEEEAEEEVEETGEVVDVNESQQIEGKSIEEGIEIKEIETPSEHNLSGGSIEMDKISSDSENYEDLDLNLDTDSRQISENRNLENSSLMTNDRIKYNGRYINTDFLGEGRVINAGGNEEENMIVEFNNKHFNVPKRDFKKLEENIKVIYINNLETNDKEAPLPDEEKITLIKPPLHETGNVTEIQFSEEPIPPVVSIQETASPVAPIQETASPVAPIQETPVEIPVETMAPVPITSELKTALVSIPETTT